MAKIFLACVNIQDGEHEHFSHGMVEAKTLPAAKRIVQAEIKKEEAGGEYEDGQQGYWSYGDGLTSSVLQSVKPITKQQAKTLEKLGVCYFIN